MKFGDREKKYLGYLILVVAMVVASYLGAYNGAPPLPPMPEIGAQSIPTGSGPSGDFVSKSYGGQFDDAMHVVAPTANATADTAFRVNNLSVAQPFSIQDAGTPVLEGYNGGGVKAYAPTAVATSVPAWVVDSAGVSNLWEVRDAATPVAWVQNGGTFVVTTTLASGPSGALTVTDGLPINPTNTYMALTAAGAVTPTLATTGTYVVGQWVFLVNTANQTITIADTARSTALALGQYDTALFVWDGTGWVQLGTSNN